MRGRQAAGMLNSFRMSSSHASFSRSMSWVREALVTSVMWMPPVRAAGEVPEQPGVDIAEQRVADAGLFTGAGNVVEDQCSSGRRK